MAIRFLSPTAGRVLLDDARAEQIAAGFVFTEGPLWDSRGEWLLFSDIPANRIYRWKDGVGVEVVREPSGKSNGLAWDRDGRLLACEHLARRISITREDGAVEALVETYGGRRLNSPNDLVVHSGGGVYFSDPPYGIQSEAMGSLQEQEQAVNGLFLLRPGAAEPDLLASDFDRPNGLAFSPDERLLYVNDTPRYHTRVLDVKPDGALGPSRPFAEFSAAEGEGRPDGMKVDLEGHVYTTGPGGLWILSAAGEMLAHVQLPEKSANCAWGDDGHSLYITASTSLYRLRTRIPGALGLRQMERGRG